MDVNYLKAVIRKIKETKKERGIEPSDALDREIIKLINTDINRTLNAMYKDGSITVSKSLNNKIVKLNE